VSERAVFYVPTNTV